MKPISASLTDVLLATVTKATQDLHVALPCKIESYDVAAQTINVKPMLKRSFAKLDGTLQHEEFPVIPNVPVALPRFGSWFLSAPLAAGDFVFVVCSERNMDIWREKGTISVSGELATHTLDGAVAFPCNLYPSSQALGTVHPDNMVIGKDAGAQIHIKPNGQIHIYEENADQFVALGQYCDTRFEAIESFLNSHTHSGVTPGLGTSGTVASPISAGTSVQATKVKAT